MPYPKDNRTAHSRLFGKGVKEVLSRLKKSQYWLAHETEIGVSSINRIVTGKSEAQLGTAMTIASALRCTVEKLVEIGTGVERVQQ